jgi:hypothetical protein
MKGARDLHEIEFQNTDITQTIPTLGSLIWNHTFSILLPFPYRTTR